MNNILIVEFIAYIIFWWLGIYVLFQNINEKINKILAGFFVSISVLFASDILTYTAPNLKIYSIVFRAFNTGPYFAIALLFHLTFTTLSTHYKNKQKLILWFAYLGAATFSLVDTFTNLITDTNQRIESSFFGNWIFSHGSLNYLMLVWGLLLLLITFFNLLWLFFKAKRVQEKIKIILALGCNLFFIFTGIFISINYYVQTIPMWGLIFSLLVGLGTLILAVDIVVLGLFLEEPLVKNKNFQYSSLTIFTLVVIYLTVINLVQIPFSYNLTILLLIIIPLMITTHYTFDWISDLSRNLIFLGNWQLSGISDAEVAQVLRNYNRPSRLEDSSLLNLPIIQVMVRKKDAQTPIDALRSLVKHAVEYCKPEENESHRTRQNIKYQILKMIAFEQAEEGQILWELGFEEYPVRILSLEKQHHVPKLHIESPADYTFTSRNAFLNLKQEAIHDLAWRISYLNKQIKH